MAHLHVAKLIEGVRPLEKHAHACGGGNISVVTNMVWMYGATWGPTLRLCCDGQRTRNCAAKDCVTWTQAHARQLELVEVLRRNVVHDAVADVHVLLGEVDPVRRYLARLPWFERHGACKLRLVEIAGQRPSFKHYMQYISTSLLGRSVVLVNQDIFLAEGWERLPRMLAPPRTALLLSRYHRRVAYSTRHSAAAAWAEGLFNASPPARGALGGARTCDMTGGNMAVWKRSLCTAREHNFGSYDAYAMRLVAPLTAGQLDVFDYPQNAWGGENIFLYILQEMLGLRMSNPCLTLVGVHMHCELPSSFGPSKVGDKRRGKKDVAVAVQAKMKKLGLTITLPPEKLGTLALRVE